MPVTFTITWYGVLLTLLAIIGMVLLVYLILLIRKLLETLKQVDSVLADAKIITGVAADKAQKVDGIIDGAAETVETVVNAVKGNQSLINAATSLVNGASSLAGMMKKTEKKIKRHKPNR
ncbi:MAG: hypothetical protein IKW01_01555 [Firmicutes bacterium]|nr:hypothetical protein [Bacillota bacterium]